MTNSQAEYRALGLMVIASLLWPILEHTGVSLMGRHHALQVVFLRYSAHLVVLLALVLPLRGVSALRTRRPWLQLLRGLCMFGMPMCFVLGRDYGSVRWMWSMFWTMPLVAVIGAMLLLRERPQAASWIVALGGALGAIGLMGGHYSLGSTVFGIAMGGTVAGYMILSRMLRDEALPASLFYTAIGAGVPTAALVWRFWTPVLPSEVLTILVVGMLSVLILAAFDTVLEWAPVALAVPALGLVPIWEATMGATLQHALPGTRQWLGIAVILGTFALLIRARMQRARLAVQ